MSNRSVAEMSQCLFSWISVGSQGLMMAPRPSMAQLARPVPNSCSSPSCSHVQRSTTTQHNTGVMRSTVEDENRYSMLSLTWQFSRTKCLWLVQSSYEKISLQKSIQPHKVYLAVMTYETPHLPIPNHRDERQRGVLRTRRFQHILPVGQTRVTASARVTM
jgi:hypothetical protein